MTKKHLLVDNSAIISYMPFMLKEKIRVCVYVLIFRAMVTILKSPRTVGEIKVIKEKFL